MDRLLTDKKIGDLLDLEKEFTYPRSDGGLVSTIDCRDIVEAEHKATLEAVGESAVAVEIEGDYLWLKLPRGLISEPIKVNLRGERPEDKEG